MSTREIVVRLIGDADSLGKAFQGGGRQAQEFGEKVGQVAEDIARESRKAGEEMGHSLSDKLFEVGEAGGNAEQGLRGVSDVTTFLGEQMGVSLGPMQEMTAAFADLGGGVEGLLKGGPALVAQIKTLPSAILPAVSAAWAHVTALLAEAAAFIAANAPIILIIAGLAALAAGVLLVIKYWDQIVETVPGLKPAIEAVSGFVTGTLIPALTAIWEKGLKPVIDFATDNWPVIATIISGPFAPIVLLATDAFGVRSAIQGAISGAIDFVRDHWQVIATIISGPFAPLVALATDAFGVRSALEGAVTALWDGIRRVFNDGVGFISGLGGTFFNAALSIGSNLKDGVVNGLTGIGSTITDLLKTGVNGAIGLVNGFIQGLNSIGIHLHVPDWFPVIGGKGFDWDVSIPTIPTLARGGIVVAGDNASGIEAIVPLERAAEMGFGGGGGDTFNATFNVTVNGEATPETVERVKRALVDVVDEWRDRELGYGAQLAGARA